ncbi:MAG: hypothetical protein CVU59_04460 [Deltaproteobacteria bacterium HGW-Deltaproteobacteria-17]|nr:MAG: hypothetical protein CVU59_04460 [Deltaproteobacteria bacterium HGW-Deltaproteobacteria-17]
MIMMGLSLVIATVAGLSPAAGADRVLVIPNKGFGSMFNDLKQFKNPKENMFNRWMGSDTSRLYVTFPEGTEVAGVKTYAGFWAHKMKKQDTNEPFFISGDYEFIYYKFTGISTLGERMTYNMYRLRINAETLLSEENGVSMLFRDLEVQQSNFDSNFVRGTVGLGVPFFKLRSREVGVLVSGYTGVAVQSNFAARIPGIDRGEEAPRGASSTSGLEFKFTWRRILGHLKFQFSFFNPDSMFNRYTIRMSIRNVLFDGDYIWIQLDSELPILGSSYQANMIFLSYYRKF